MEIMNINLVYCTKQKSIRRFIIEYNMYINIRF